jgi:hypothetical protein
MRAFQGFSYSLDEIRSQLESGKIPFAFATKRSEKSHMKYKGALAAADNLNKRGWKLCHMVPFSGVGGPGPSGSDDVFFYPLGIVAQVELMIVRG